MRRSKRTDRIDYNELATSGRRVVKANSGAVTDDEDSSDSTDDKESSDIDKELPDTNITSKISKSTEITELSNLFNNCSFNDTMTDHGKQVRVAISTLQDEIDDFIDENEIYDDISLEECNCVQQKIEDMRLRYRKLSKEIEVTEGYEEMHGKAFINTINNIKAYIKKVSTQKRCITSQSNAEKAGESEARRATLEFQADEVKRMMKDLEHVYDVEFNSLSDSEVKRRKTEINAHNKEIRKIGEKIHSILHDSLDDVMMRQVANNLRSRYEKTLSLKMCYVKELDQISSDREVDKHDLFQVSSLNIKLQKFKGYETSMDIYTFRTTFEKIHLKSTPTNLLPDLLKNNYLDGQALTLVSALEKIEEIWRRLISAYGNCKIMLSKKLEQLDNIDGLWRNKQPAKVIDGLSKVVNCMQDLMKLSKRHDIEKTLFYGDAIEKIYKLVGDDRMTKWFGIVHGKDWEGEQLWIEFITFLEKCISINQQKILHGIHHKNNAISKDVNKRNFFTVEDGFYKGTDDSPNVSSDIERSRTSKDCFICGEDDHVATMGPGGSRIIQYFVCEKFVCMTPAERFTALRKKGLCIQCLFPGAKYQMTKHKEGKCQKDFVCQHPSHNKNPNKMHVLVCEAHKDLPENKELLKLYRDRCIHRVKSEIPSFSKKIHLASKVNSEEDVAYHSTQRRLNDDGIDENEKAIYMLQTIKVQGQRYTIFFDSGCGDFVATINAIRRIGDRAKQVHAGPITLGGVGGITTKSHHGIFSVKLPLSNGKDATLTGVCIDKITETFPFYPLSGKVENDIIKDFEEKVGNRSLLPRLPKEVGGNVDFMVGIKYFRYFPELVYQLSSGLTIHRSHFKNVDGTRGVIGGPHQVFTEIEKFHSLCQESTLNFVTNQNQIQSNGFQGDRNTHILDFHDDTDIYHDIYHVNFKEDASTSNGLTLIKTIEVLRKS